MKTESVTLVVVDSRATSVKAAVAEGAVLERVSPERARELAVGLRLRRSQAQLYRRGTLKGTGSGGRAKWSYVVPRRWDGVKDWARIVVMCDHQSVPKGALRRCVGCGAQFWLDAYEYQVDLEAWDFGLPAEVVEESRRPVFYGWTRCESCRKVVSRGKATKEQAFARANELRAKGVEVVKGKAGPGQVSWYDLFNPLSEKEAASASAGRQLVQSALGDWRLSDDGFSSTVGVAPTKRELEALDVEDTEGWQASRYDGDGPENRAVTEGQKAYVERWLAAKAWDLEQSTAQENGADAQAYLEHRDPVVREFAKRHLR